MMMLAESSIMRGQMARASDLVTYVRRFCATLLSVNALLLSQHADASTAAAAPSGLHALQGTSRLMLSNRVQ